MVSTGKTVVLWSAAGAVLDAKSAGRLFVVHEGGRLRLENITLANGESGSGGCIYHEGGVLSVRGGLFLRCAARDGFSGGLLGRSSSGGGIFMEGGQVDLTVRNAAEAPGRSRRLGAHDAADGLPQMNTRALYLLLLRYL